MCIVLFERRMADGLRHFKSGGVLYAAFNLFAYTDMSKSIFGLASAQ